MIEKLFELIAPDECLGCGTEGKCLCFGCEEKSTIAKVPACVMCNKQNTDNRVCKRCRAKTSISGASIAYRYSGITKDLISRMKYENGRSVARYFAALLPRVELSCEQVVCCVPCDGPSRRARGYDQAELIAKHYARFNHLKYRNILLRIEHKKQVGRSRQERFKNVQGNFEAKGDIQGLNVILIDDVITTGATISECAKTLRLAGAKKVWAVAVAKK